jgi:hypothetical protein
MMMLLGSRGVFDVETSWICGGMSSWFVDEDDAGGARI